jgi:hypothetical protein
MRIIAVDWSGKLKRAEEFLRLAEVREGHLVDLRNGLLAGLDSKLFSEVQTYSANAPLHQPNTSSPA